MNDQTCSICYDEDSLDKNIITTKCGHTFHRDCLLKWYKRQNTCPYCRGELYFNIISNFTSLLGKELIYSYKRYGRKSVIINGIETCFIERNLKFNKIVPSAWLSFILPIPIKTRTDKILVPLYSIPFNNSEIYISPYARLAILYNTNTNTNINLSQMKDVNEVQYYNTDTPCEYIKERVFLIVYEWMFDVIHVLKKEYDFHYEQEYNTVICDLLVETIREFKLTKTEFIQGIAICIIHNILKFDNIHVSMDNLNYYTMYIYNIKDLEKYDTYQKKYIDNNLIKTLTL
jgi:hypothetical protein